jgi:pyruvate/2-oxoacid:ferredoxin oxidoreductase beta subunit
MNKKIIERVLRTDSIRIMVRQDIRHLLSPCPPGWRIPSEHTIQISRLAVRSRVFPLYEIENGTYTIHEESHLAPVKEYLKIQGHFSHLTDQDTEKIQEMVDDEWERLLRKARC